MMNKIISRKSIFKSQTTQCVIILNLNSSTLKLQIDNNSSELNCTIKILGSLDGEKYYNMQIIDEVNLDLLDTIKKEGIYAIDSLGYWKMKIEVVSIEGSINGYVTEVIE